MKVIFVKVGIYFEANSEANVTTEQKFEFGCRK